MALLRLTLLAITYWVAARLSLTLALVHGQVTPVWPPTGIAVVAILVFGRGVWPAIFVAAFAVNLPLGPSPLGAAFIAMGKRLPAGHRVAIASSSGGGGAWVADACALAGLDMPVLDEATRAKIDVYLPPYGCSQNPVDVTAQAIHERGYAEFARLAASSPNVDGVILVVTGRHPRFLIEDRDHLIALGRDSKKPVLLWSYTRPASVCVDLLSEAGLPLFTNVHNCARTMRVMADYRAARQAFLKGH